MKPIIKYKRDQQEFITELRILVNNYFEGREIEKQGQWQILVKTFFMASVYFIPFVLMLTGFASSTLPVFICWFIMGLGMSGLGMATMHDANHYSFSKRQWVNRLFSGSLYLLGGFPVNWKYQHNTLHHGYTNIEGHDEDIAPIGLLRFSPHKPLKKIHKYQFLYAWFFYSLMTFSWITIKDFMQLKRYKKEGVRLNDNGSDKQLFFYLVLSKIFYYGIFLALPLILVAQPWYLLVAGFMMMHFTSGITLSIIFQTAHVVPTSEYPLPDNQNEMDNTWAMHQLYTTSNFAPKSRIFTWLIGGLNYQVVHHLFPNISHVHYKKISGIVKDTAHRYHLPYHENKTFFGAVYQHAIMLRKLGRDENQISAQVKLPVRNKLAMA